MLITQSASNQKTPTANSTKTASTITVGVCLAIVGSSSAAMSRADTLKKVTAAYTSAKHGLLLIGFSVEVDLSLPEKQRVTL